MQTKSCYTKTKGLHFFNNKSKLYLKNRGKDRQANDWKRTGTYSVKEQR
jgi:hypothetical protein